MTCFVFANPRGGSGKTVGAALFAMELTKMGRKVVVVDASRFGSLSHHLFGGFDQGVERIANTPPQNKTSHLLKPSSRGLFGGLFGGRAAGGDLGEESPASELLRVFVGDDSLWPLRDDDPRDMASRLRAALPADAVVIIDTDHELHTGYGRAMLHVADVVVVPTSSMLVDLTRLKSRLGLVQILQEESLSNKRCSLLFNNLPATSFQSRLRLENGAELPFTVAADVRQDIERILRELANPALRVAALPQLSGKAQAALQRGERDLQAGPAGAVREMASALLSG